jgi:hypothetical protein
MLFNVAVALVVLWLVGLGASYTFGGFIHLLVIAAFGLVLLQVVSDQKRT